MFRELVSEGHEAVTGFAFCMSVSVWFAAKLSSSISGFANPMTPSVTLRTLFGRFSEIRCKMGSKSQELCLRSYVSLIDKVVVVKMKEASGK